MIENTFPVLIVVAGPTAAGKTDLGFRLAQRLDTEIISGDSRQFYKELKIGTAKPEPPMLEAIKHHFIDSLSITDEYTAGRFEREALGVLSHIFKKRRAALLVGGSGLYIRALCEGLDDIPVVEEGIREKWNALVKNEGLEEVRNFVQERDPEFYRQADIYNPARLVRAAEVIEATGKPFSFFRKGKETGTRSFSVIKIGLTADRTELYERIDTRMDRMMAAGLFAEAEQFFEQRHLQALQTVGYQEVFGFLEGHYNKAEAIRLLKRNSRRYAKRQLTWFRKDTNIQWFSREDEQGIYSFLKEKGIDI